MALGFKKGSVLENVPKEALPQHIGIIMDGNGRWAKRQGMPRKMGHRQGAKVFSDIAKYCRDIGIPYLTVYAFSTENWSRPKDEVDAIMNLLSEYLADVKKHQEENIRLCFLGERTKLRSDLQEQIADIEERSKNNDGVTVNIALNYGGRDEIIRAVRKLAKQCAAGEIDPDTITESMLSDMLDTSGQPDPDMIIRPSGEKRTSNFLPWQSTYSEFIFMNILWPDFAEADLDAAIAEYHRRNRRFGGV